jgi:thioredoxin reductase/NAD-dependent dihydropyrimidine dehydrogenase PreA subunit
MGCAVTVYEATSVPGGMLRLGIPEYRLPRELLDLEIEAITTLGPTIEFETALGRDFLLMDLRREFEAVFLGIGTHASRRLNVEGERQDGVLHAVDFLLNVNLGGYSLDLGQSIIVIGGGNVAMDVARTAARLGQETVSGGDVELALDVARAARRLGGTREVHCLVVESREEMLADRYEVEEALAEGIEVHNNFAPVRILGDGRTASGIRTMDVTRAFDEQGRFNPELRLGTARDWPCDSVIVSIGQVGDLAWMREEDGLEQLPGGRLKVDTQTLMTTADGVFAGGDIAFGPRLIINAVADGQRAAMGIDAYLRGRPLHRVRRGTFTSIDPKSYARYAPQEGFPGIPRRQPPTLPVERRIGISCVEETYEAEEARRQAARCLICNLNPIFEGDLCILCNGCVDVCPMDCLKLVPSHHIAGDKSVAAFVKTHAGGDGTAMLFDPAHCIRCGLCARRCPTGAVVMHTLSFQESWKEEGAI